MHGHSRSSVDSLVRGAALALGTLLLPALTAATPTAMPAAAPLVALPPQWPDELHDHWGFIDLTSMKLASGEDLLPSLTYLHPDDDNAEDQTVARVELPRPVGPGESVTLDVEFVDQLTPVIDRSGYSHTFYFV